MMLWLREGNFYAAFGKESRPAHHMLTLLSAVAITVHNDDLVCHGVDDE